MRPFYRKQWYEAFRQIYGSNVAGLREDEENSFPALDLGFITKSPGARTDLTITLAKYSAP